MGSMREGDAPIQGDSAELEAGDHRMLSQLSVADVQQLMTNPAAEIRARTAAKVTDQLNGNRLSTQERALAFDILGKLADDASSRVRKALAEGLCRTTDLPRDLALKLAADVENVALPMLELCTIFTDEDLIALVRTGPEPKQIAIASRAEVSEPVCHALIDTNHTAVVKALMVNEGARLDESCLSTVLDRFGDHGEIKSAMVHRTSLPLTISERLVTMVSEQLRQHLLVHHELPLKVASDLALESRERAIGGLVEDNAGAPDIRALAKQLYGNGRLTPGLVVRVLCAGDLTFFEEALALMAVVSRENARALVHDQGSLGLKAICERAGFAPPFLEAVRIALGMFHEQYPCGSPEERRAFCQEMIERIKTRFLGTDLRDLEDLLSHLRKLAETA